MTLELEARPVAAAAYTPMDRAALTAECLGCIITGRPFPDAVRAPMYDLARPASVEDGIARILGRPH